MACDEEPEISVQKIDQMLSEAQLLMREIEEMLKWCTSISSSNQRQRRETLQERQTSIVDDGDTLVIDGLRFESATSSEDLRTLSSLAGAGR